MQTQNKAWLCHLLYWAHISPTATSATNNNEGRERERRWKGGKEKKKHKWRFEIIFRTAIISQVKVM